MAHTKSHYKSPKRHRNREILDMETFYIIKTDEEMSMAYPQDIELSQEQWSGCVKLLYAMNRAGFDLSKLKIITNKTEKTLDK